MQPLKKLARTLEQLSDPDHYLFSVSDFYPLFPVMSPQALRVLLGRAVKAELLGRVCRGIYLYPKCGYQKGFELYHTAGRLREETFCYLSLESALSEAGILSQIPLGWITLMTGGRSGLIHCGKWGHIEFIHTGKSPRLLASSLVYDTRYRLWRASPELALREMRTARRPMDLVNPEAAHDPV